MTDYVMVGNGVASVAAAETVRAHDEDGNIKIVSKEPYLAYSRPLISYLLGGKVTEDSMPYKDESFYEENDIDVLFGKEAKSIDPDRKSVILEDGSEIHFDNLLIATGGSPFLPEVEGKDLRGVFTFTQWRDVKEIREYIEERGVEEVVIVGGGLIGMKVMEALMNLGLEVIVVELADKIMSATFDKKASDLIIKLIRENNCEIITESTVEKIEGEEKVESAILKEGGEVDCDMVIFAIGVTPNTELVEDIGIETGRGIIVDKHMQTNLSDIYAAGDVVEIPDMVTGETRPIAIWPNANRQGEIAGANMAGESEEYEGSFAMNSIEICGVPTISVGLTDPNGDYEIIDYYDEESFVYKKLVLDEDRLVGAIFANDVDRAGIYTGLVKSRFDVSDFRDHLLDNDFGLIHLPQYYKEHLLSGSGMKI